MSARAAHYKTAPIGWRAKDSELHHDWNVNSAVARDMHQITWKEALEPDNVFGTYPAAQMIVVVA
jgi:hypothetical protein